MAQQTLMIHARQIHARMVVFVSKMAQRHTAIAHLVEPWGNSANSNAIAPEGRDVPSHCWNREMWNASG
jgi:hypothetical protein